MKKIVLTALIALSMPIAANMEAKNNIKYPKAPTDKRVKDVYFGVEVADIYRPLEDDNAEATAKWVEAENAVTDKYISAIPFRGDIRARLAQLNDYAKPGLPGKEADGRYYFYFNDGLRNQSVLYRADSPDAPGEVFLDPNTLSTDGTVALTGVSLSKGDGKYTAYRISRSGSDWTEIYLLDTETRQPLDDHIMWAKFTGTAWHGPGFYYSAYDAPDQGAERSGKNEGHKIFYHKIGTPQSQDILIFEDKDHPLHFHGLDLSEDNSAMWVTISGQGNGNALLVKDIHGIDDPAQTTNVPWITVEAGQDDTFEPLDARDGILYVYTSFGAPKYRVVAIPVATAADRSTWREVVPEANEVLTSVAPVGRNKLALKYIKDASHRVRFVNMDGSEAGELPLPGLGTVSLSTSPENEEIFYGFTSFTSPSKICQYDIDTNTTKVLKQVEINGFNPDDYVTEQVFYPSKDGTMIPMFLTYKKGLKRDGTNPVYLYGYGGFNISLYPSFSANRLLWLENGGIYAQATLRGGGEYGEDWHVAGTLMQKQNVFDDFISAAEYLVDSGWTTPQHIAIEGGSNGGLLVGACVNQRPDLFAVAIPRVGVMDMMRYHLFTIGWNWSHDYGTSADSPEMAQYLLAYSPLHNVKSGKGVQYPAILVTTADHDDRVVPAHSFKYAAALQAAKTGDKPKLIRIDSKAGHGAGKPIAKVLDEYADIYSFIFYNMGLTPVK